MAVGNQHIAHKVVVIIGNFYVIDILWRGNLVNSFDHANRKATKPLIIGDRLKLSLILR